jgi:hypothetical protein
MGDQVLVCRNICAIFLLRKEMVMIALQQHSPVHTTDDSKVSVVGKSLLRAAAYLQVPSRVLAKIIGLSEASISRIGQGTFRLDPGSKPFELALLFIRLFRSLDAITGGDQATARAWIRSENTALGGKPLDLMMRLSGLVDVIAYVDARRAVI